jgi:hypothetical protein
MHLDIVGGGAEAAFRFLMRHTSFEEPELYGAVARHCAGRVNALKA